jgi:hypothetical protein
MVHVSKAFRRREVMALREAFSIGFKYFAIGFILMMAFYGAWPV